MITRLEVKNFRCFDTLSLNGLKQFNLIVGESGSGKTALLETLFLVASGSPDSFFRLRRWRGFGENPLTLNGTKEAYDGLFRYLFHDGRGSFASLRATDSDLGRRSLDIYFEGQNTLDLSLKSPENSLSVKPIHFKWDVGNQVTNVSLEIKDGAIRGVGSAEVFPLHFISQKNTSSTFDASLFSQISRRSQTDELIASIRKIFPIVKSLSLEIQAGETLIHAEIEGFKEKIPLNELSGGLNKFVSIAVAIASNPRGVVAVDEIENGFYFKNQESVIRGFVGLCEHYQVQLFASTHSWEFLQAFAPAFKDHESELCLIKASYNDGNSSMKIVGGAASLAAITQDIEIRN